MCLPVQRVEAPTPEGAKHQKRLRILMILQVSILALFLIISLFTPDNPTFQNAFMIDIVLCLLVYCAYNSVMYTQVSIYMLLSVFNIVQTVNYVSSIWQNKHSFLFPLLSSNTPKADQLNVFIE